MAPLSVSRRCVCVDLIPGWHLVVYWIGEIGLRMFEDVADGMRMFERVGRGLTAFRNVWKGFMVYRRVCWMRCLLWKGWNVFV